jgi:hypothetical protein
MLIRTQTVCIVLCMFAVKSLFAQTSPAKTSADFECKLCLKEVHFGGTPNSNYITIYENETEAELKAPQYEVDCKTSAPKSSLPVGYVSNTKVRVKAVFNAAYCDKVFYARGAAEYILSNGAVRVL